MDKLPFEIFTYIIQFLNHADRLNCCRVCKPWNHHIQRSYLLFDTVVCDDLAKDRRIKQYFKQNRHLSTRVTALEYNMAGELCVDYLHELPTILPNVNHFELFTNDSLIYSCVNSKGRRVAPRNNSGFLPQAGSLREVYEGCLNETFEGWSATLESMEETSTNMLSAFMLNRSTQPFEHLTRLWLNYSNIRTSKLTPGMNYLMRGLKQAPALEEITLNHTHVNLAQLDIIHQQCHYLRVLRLDCVEIANHPLAPGQRFMYHVPTLHYEPLEALTMKHVEIVASRIIGGTPLLSYMAAKYKHAERIVCNVSNERRDDMSDSYIDQAIRLISSCTMIKHFDSNLFRVTPSFLRLMNTQGINMIQTFNMDYEDDIENFVVLCTTDNYTVTLKDLTMEINYYPDRFNNILLNLKNLTRLHLLNCGDRLKEPGLGTDEFQYYEATMMPFNALLNGLEHLEQVHLQGFYISLNREEKTQHKIKKIILTECTFESFTDKSEHVLFSPCNYISTCCLQLRHLKLHGYWSYDPQESEINLKLFDHKQLTSVEVLIRCSWAYLRHLDEEGAETWFEIQQADHSQGIEYFPVSDQSLIQDLRLYPYFTIECADSSLFYTPKVYYQEPYQF